MLKLDVYPNNTLNTDTAVVKRKHENVLGARPLELVHCARELAALDHGRDGDPAVRLQRRDGGCAAAGGDRECAREVLALHIVRDIVVPLGSEHTGDARLEETDERLELGREARVLGGRGDEDRLRGHDGVDCVEARGAHGVTGLWGLVAAVRVGCCGLTDKVDCRSEHIGERGLRKIKSENSVCSVWLDALCQHTSHA